MLSGLNYTKVFLDEALGLRIDRDRNVKVKGSLVVITINKR